MPCPFLQSASNGIENGYDSEDSNASMLDGPMNASTTETSNHQEQVAKEPLDYTKYLLINKLLSGIQCLSHIDPSDDTSAPVHDEHYFIVIHQIFELWFKQILFDIDSIRDIFQNNHDIKPHMFNINLRLTRIGKIWNQLIIQLQLLNTMTPMEFLEFRNFVTPASGFQSLQFRLIEMKLGLTDKFRSAFKTKYFTETMFKNQQANQLNTAVKEHSLLYLIEQWLERIYDETSFKFGDVFAKSVERMIKHDKEEKIMNGADEETAERGAETTKRQFSKMIDPAEYKIVLDNGERRISQKAMFAALMIAHYHQEPCFQQLYEMISLLMDMDGLMASWRYQHVLLVLRQIGRKAGTGGTDGFSYLYQTISDKYQIFTDFFNIASYLVPQRFLPKFNDGSMLSAKPMSSLTLQPHHEVPVIRKKQTQLPKYQPTPDPIQFYQTLFFLFLFAIGAVFGIFIRRFVK